MLQKFEKRLPPAMIPAWRQAAQRLTDQYFTPLSRGSEGEAVSDPPIWQLGSLSRRLRALHTIPHWKVWLNNTVDDIPRFAEEPVGSLDDFVEGQAVRSIEDVPVSVIGPNDSAYTGSVSTLVSRCIEPASSSNVTDTIQLMQPRQSSLSVWERTDLIYTSAASVPHRAAETL